MVDVVMVVVVAVAVVVVVVVVEAGITDSVVDDSVTILVVSEKLVVSETEVVCASVAVTDVSDAAVVSVNDV